MTSQSHHRRHGTRPPAHDRGAVAVVAWLLAGAWVLGATAPVVGVDFFRADGFGTPLAPLGDASVEDGFVLAVDSRSEAEAAGLLARRRLLSGGAAVREWRRSARDAGSLEHELQAGQVVSERHYDAGGRLREERRFDAAGALLRREVLTYRGTTLHQVHRYAGGGALLATATYELTAAGRLRRFTNFPAPGAGAAADPVTVLSLVFRHGDLIEERLGAGGDELIVRAAAPGRPAASEVWAGERLVMERRQLPAAGAGPAREVVIDQAAGTRRETSFDSHGRPLTVRVFALPGVPDAGNGGLREERSYGYRADGTLHSLAVASQAGLEIWEYSYDDAGRRIREAYRHRGELRRVSTFPAAGERVDELYGLGNAVLRVFWRDGLRLREEFLQDGVVMRTRDLTPAEETGPS